MAEKKPMGCVTLFAVIVAALVFVFFMIPAGCSIAGVAAMVGLAKSVETPPPPPPSAKVVPPAGAEPRVESENITDALRRRAKWPMQISLARECTVDLTTGNVVLEKGLVLSATGLGADGMLNVSFAGQTVPVQFTDTDFVQRLNR